MNQTKFGELLGLEPQHITNWKRRGMPPEWHAPVAKALGYTVDELLGLISEVRPFFSAKYPPAPEEMEPIDLDAHPDLERIRRVKLRLQAGVNGFAIEPDDSDGMPIFFRSDWLQQRGFKPYNLIAIKVMGQSMEPNLYPDDMVVINTADTEPKDGKVFAVNYEGEPVIKRMVRDGGTWWLSSDNPDQRRFPRKECTEGSCIIVGQVIHKQSEQI